MRQEYSALMGARFVQKLKIIDILKITQYGEIAIFDALIVG